MFALAVALGVAQNATVSQRSKTLPIPKDSAAESYEIYSELLPGREIEWGDAQRSFWLLEEQTKAEPVNSSCKTGGMMNPIGRSRCRSHSRQALPKSSPISIEDATSGISSTHHSFT